MLGSRFARAEPRQIRGMADTENVPPTSDQGGTGGTVGPTNTNADAVTNGVTNGDLSDANNDRGGTGQGQGQSKLPPTRDVPPPSPPSGNQRQSDVAGGKQPSRRGGVLPSHVLDVGSARGSDYNTARSSGLSSASGHSSASELDRPMRHRRKKRVTIWRQEEEAGDMEMMAQKETEQARIRNAALGPRQENI